MPLIVGGGLALGGAAGSIVGSGKQADAAQNIASQQQSEAQRNRAQALGFAQPTASELGQLSMQNQLALQANQFQSQRLQLTASQMAAIDPTIKMAFQQQAQILRGQIPSYLQPFQKQQQMADQAQQSRLNAQLGSGYGSSSAGIASNAQFAQQSSLGLMQAQQQALAALGAVGTQAVGAQSQLGADTFNGFNSAANINQNAFGMSNSIAQRQINAALGSPTASYAGGQYAGQLMGGQALAGMGSTLAGLGVSTALAGAFGPQIGQASGNAGSFNNFGAFAGSSLGASNPGMVGSPWTLFGRT